MVLILDGNSEIVAHEWSEIGNLTCLRHLLQFDSSHEFEVIFKNDPFSFKHAQLVLSYHKK